jgi:hypothetical protein
MPTDPAPTRLAALKPAAPKFFKAAALAAAFLAALVLSPGVQAGNFYAGVSPASIPWPGGIVPYEFTNTLSAAQKQTYLDGLREWELAANVKFVPRTSQTRWILFDYNLNGPDLVAPGYNPQVVTVNNLSRSQVCHEMGHSFGLTHENIRVDQPSHLLVVTNNIYNEPANIQWFTIDPTSVTNGPYDFESVMHLGWDFVSVQPGELPTQQPRPAFSPRYDKRMGNLCLSPGDRAALAYLYGPPAIPLTNVVTATADAGPGSLRAALYYVTDHPAAPLRFDIPTSDAGYSNGVFTLRLSGALPPLVANGMVIDGSTQPGFVFPPVIFVDGSGILPDPRNFITGLLLYSASNQVRNLSFSGFTWNGITLGTPDTTNNTIAGCWLGLDWTGTNAAPNAYQGILIYQGASGNVIGGTNAFARNVLSGNRQYGVWLSDSNTAGNVILGNYIGTDPGGQRAVANGLAGLMVVDGAHDNFIGAPGAGNVVSGNTNAGLWLRGPGTTRNTFQGNLVGLNAAGTAALPNTFVGMYADSGARTNQILNNVFSGHLSEGLRMTDTNTSGNVVQGNYFGTDRFGSNAIPNGFAGIALRGGASGNLIGGLAVAARNLMSGNYYGAVIADPGTSGNVFQGNIVGLNAGGAVPLANTFAGVGLWGGASGNLIGGAAAGAGNVISGNGSYGVFVADSGTSANVFQGNRIGTDLTGTNAAGNAFANVGLIGGANGNLIGGVAPGEGNLIAFASFGPGVVLYDAPTTNNAIRGNSIFSNGGLGIDFNNDGVTPNDAGDPDPGPNLLQNFPVLTNAYGLGAATIVAGRLNSLANRSFFIDVYRSPAADPSGYGEGQTYAGTVSVTTDGAGNATFALTNASGNFSGQYLTATATAAGGDTSEFGAALLATNRAVAFAQFTGPLAWSATGFAFTVTLATNFGYRIQAATNIGAQPVAWSDLTNFIAATNAFRFIDRAASNFPARYYRVISP